jgi:ABC-type transporter Mla subunit MlaD
MPGTTTQFKLGLFTLAAVAGLVAIAVGLGIRAGRKETVRFQTYFSESTQGLDVGAPVKYRGVRIGSVSDISIAPDRKQVSVGLAIDRSAVKRLDLEQIPDGLRTLLVWQGITGVKLIDMDFVDPIAQPPPRLSFEPGPRYIPSRLSVVADLEARLGEVTRAVPELVESTTKALDKIRNLVEDFQEQRVADKVGRLVDNLDASAGTIQLWTRDLRRARLAQRAVATFDRIDTLVQRLDRTAAELEGASELIESATRVSDSFAEVGRSARGSTKELEQTLRDVAEAARSVRDFMDALERQPDMLLKGRARPR